MVLQNSFAATYPEITILKNTRNEGFSKAHNHAIGISSGEYILPLNFDIILTPTFVEEMVKAIESSCEIGIVSGKLYALRDGEETNIIDSTGITMQGMFPADRDKMKLIPVSLINQGISLVHQERLLFSSARCLRILSLTENILMKISSYMLKMWIYAGVHNSTAGRPFMHRRQSHTIREGLQDKTIQG